MSTAAVRSGSTRFVAINVIKALGSGVLMLAIVFGLWVIAVKLVDNPFVAKGPGDVKTFLFDGDEAAANRSDIFHSLRLTLRDSVIGFAAGMLAAVVGAGLIVLSKGIEATIMPIAMILRSVPLIALAPVITIIFHRGLLSVAVIAGIVVLFPALVNMVFGLRAASPMMREVVQVYGGSEWAALRKVAFPSALPSMFASIRISVPGAITGALLAEWLSTGRGIGYDIVSAAGQSENNRVWALVVVVTLVSLVGYTLAQILESFVLARYGRDGGRAG